MLEYILGKKKKYILILPSRCNYTKSYPKILVIEDWIANTPKMAANVDDEFQADKIRVILDSDFVSQEFTYNSSIYSRSFQKNAQGNENSIGFH